MSKPIIKNGLDVDDIRAIRTYNAQMHAKMTREEIINDINSGAKEAFARMEKIRLSKKEVV